MTEIKYAFNTEFFSFKYTFACKTFSAEPFISNEEETVAKSACRLRIGLQAEFVQLHAIFARVSFSKRLDKDVSGQGRSWTGNDVTFDKLALFALSFKTCEN